MVIKNKSKKNKKSAKNKIKDTWSFEGGQGFEEENEPKKVYERRQTQERDESIRRSKLKHKERERSKVFNRKMARKVKFGDEEICNSETNITLKVDLKPPKNNITLKNSRPVVDRLQQFIATSLDMNEKIPGNFNELSNNPVEIDRDLQIIGHEEKKISIEQSSHISHVEDMEAIEEEDNDIDKEDVFAETNDQKSCYNWYFSSSDIDGTVSMNQTDIVKCSLTQTLESQEYHRHSTNVVVDAFIQPIDKYSDIPGIGKLWKTTSSEDRAMSNVERSLLPYLSAYVDLFVERGAEISEASLLAAWMTHISVHIVRCRTKVLRNNNKIKQRTGSADPEGGQGGRDQGFVRPRVLLLCPLRSVALAAVAELGRALGSNTTFSSWQRLQDEYGEDEDDAAPENKPVDWQETFSGNLDDDFKLGVQINPGQGKGSGADRGCYVRLFSDFYSSDLLIASPLGLRLAMEGTGPSKLTPDFLSSIEVVVLHQADVMYMQNWDHMDFVLSQLGAKPLLDRGTDFARVRPYFLDGPEATMRHRQCVVSSRFNDPALQAAFRRFANSKAGKVRFLRHDGSRSCSMAAVVSAEPLKQLFQRVPCTALASQEDERFSYFCTHILDPVLRLEQGRTLIVAPSYFSFVRLRNELLRRQADAAFVSEYSRDSEISRGRSRFFHGKHKLLLYSGRAHFFRRFLLRGAAHLIFYSLPEYPHFYSELAGLLSDGEGGGCSVTTLFTKFDHMSLQRVVGAKRAALMLREAAGATFLFR